MPQGSPIPRVLPPAPPSVAPGTDLTRPATPSASPAVDVPVRSVTIAGATAFPQERLQMLTAGLTGPSVSVGKIEAARAALLSLYRTDGFVLTTVTANVSPSGDLRFNVIEGRIAAVKLEGDIGPAGVQVLRFLNHLTEKAPIDNDTLERWLLLAQDIPGVSVHAVLQPSADDPGALTLVAQVERQVVNGLVTADNRAFRQTGPVETLSIVDINSLTQLGEKTELSIYHTDGGTQNFGQASSEFFVGGSGLKVRLYGGYGEAQPSQFLRTIGYQGFTSIFGAAATYPLIRQRQQTLNLVANLDAVETEIRTDSGVNGQPDRASRDSLRIGRLGAEYAIEDTVAGASRPAVNFASVRVSQGLPFLGGTGNGNATPGRVNERVDFTKVAIELSRTQTLFVPWNGASVALKARLLGQGSGSVLPPSEKFFLGRQRNQPWLLLGRGHRRQCARLLARAAAQHGAGSAVLRLSGPDHRTVLHVLRSRRDMGEPEGGPQRKAVVRGARGPFQHHPLHRVRHRGCDPQHSTPGGYSGRSGSAQGRRGLLAYPGAVLTAGRRGV